MKFRVFSGVIPLLAVGLLFCHCERKPPPAPIVVEAEPTIEALINTFLDGGGTYRDVPFAEVIRASSRKRVIPMDPNDEADSAILTEIEWALKATLKEFNTLGSTAKGKKRISEVSPLFEERLKELLNRAPGLKCGHARTMEGNLQRSGYPDLRVVHEESGRVVYLEPKLVSAEALGSSLRTFYFTPKGREGKVLEDAHHLLVGVEYDGSAGDWQFLRWNLVDLANFRVRLKAEFQAGNKDLYQPDLIISRGEKSD